MKFAPANFLPCRHEGFALFPNQIHVMVIAWTDLNLETWLFRRRGCSHETYYYPLQVGCFVYLEMRDDCPDNSRWDLVALLSSLKHCRFLSDTFRSRRRLPPLRFGNLLNQLIGFRGIHIVCCPFCCLWFCHSRSSPLGDSSLASYLWIVSHMRYIQSSGRQHTYAV